MTTSLAEILQSLRVHGQGGDQYDNVRIGLTGRLDTIQAAVLIEKLKIFPERSPRATGSRGATTQRWPMSRSCREVAEGFNLGMGAIHHPPASRAARRSWPRDLKAQGIPTAIYYPQPLHRLDGLQAISRGRRRRAGQRAAGRRGHSLPMHAYLDAPTQDRIIAAVRRALGD